MPQQLQTLEGTVQEVVFHSEQTGFTVFEVVSGGQQLTAVGETVGLQVGEQVKLTGSYSPHPTYGMQFRAQAIERTLPATAGAILRYLAGGAVKGVGPVLARRIVDAFGDSTLEVMEKEPARLGQVRGISPVKAAEIGEEYQKIFGIRSVMLFLSRFGLAPSVCVAVWKRWGVGAPEVISQNPYCLCSEEVGLDFFQADELAAAFGVDGQAPCRLQSGILYVLRHNLQNGHCCLPCDRLLPTAAQLLQCDGGLLEEQLQLLEQQVEVVTEEVGGRRMAYLPRFYEAERYVAGRLGMMLTLGGSPAEDAQRRIDALEEELGIRYADRQRQAIATALGGNLLILTGGPGTGKTTTLTGMIRLLDRQGLKIGLAAPTGRAAKRMGEVTGWEAKTLHRLLEVDYDGEGGEGRFRRNEKNPLPLDVVIVDEMSMVDLLLFRSLLAALRMGAKLILVGDPDQLPSVGAGNLLGDLIDSGRLPVVHLSEVFRQAAESRIVTNAHRIVEGEMPCLGDRSGDFFFLPREGAARAAQTVVQLCTQRLPRAFGFSPVTDIQVLAPTRQGPLGTAELNRQLQQVLNPPGPGKGEHRQGGVALRVGDKVMQVRNNYDLPWLKDNGEQGAGIFNGDIGVIEQIDRAAREVAIRFDDRVALYPFELLYQLEMAYAVTVHKSQGNEFEAVVIPLMGVHRQLYYRNLLYTAVTRAKKLLVLVGEARSVAAMVENNRKTLRFTGLKVLLQEL